MDKDSIDSIYSIFRYLSCKFNIEDDASDINETQCKERAQEDLKILYNQNANANANANEYAEIRYLTHMLLDCVFYNDGPKKPFKVPSLEKTKENALNNYMQFLYNINRGQPTNETRKVFISKLEQHVLEKIFSSFAKGIKMEKYLNTIYVKTNRDSLIETAFNPCSKFKYTIASIKLDLIAPPRHQDTFFLRSKLYLLDFSYFVTLVALSLALATSVVLSAAGLFSLSKKIDDSFDDLHAFYRGYRDPIAQELILTDATNEFVNDLKQENTTLYNSSDASSRQKQTSLWDKFSCCFFNKTEPSSQKEVDNPSTPLRVAI